VIIRPATAADWPAIWPIFREVVAAGDSYAYPEDLTSDQARQLWTEPPPGQTVAAVVDDHIQGTAKMGPNRGGRGAHIATASFMVSSAARGHGIGRALGRYVIDWATRQGYRAIQFNAVVETNTPAVALWQDLGFEIIGTVPDAFDHPAHGFVGLHVMHLSLTE
jgi:L-amino acid N-acyltransferase YncA